MLDPLQQALATAVQFHQSGDLASAEAICRDILYRQPRQADALHLLGMIALRRGQFDEAIAFITQAIGMNKKNPAYCLSLGHAFRLQGNWNEAAKFYGAALKLKPDFADAHFCLGTVYLDQAELEKSIRHLKSAATLSESLAAHYNLGTAYLRAGEPKSAIQHLTKALQLDRNLHQAYLNLGEALFLINEFEEARRQFAKLLELQPDAAGAHVGLGNIAYVENDIELAMRHFRQAIACQPDLAMAHLNLAHCLLKTGNFQEGWKEYEWRRWLSKPLASDIPQWDGSPLNGRRLLVLAEQGIGDRIQFARYLPLLRERTGGTVFFACQRALMKLLAPLAGPAAIVDVDKLDEGGVFDVHVNLLSLPLIFQTDAKTIPNPGAYLRADPALASRWRERLSKDGNFKIGLCWVGNPAHANDRFRSVSLDCFAPLAEMAGVTFYSLQKWMAKKPPALPKALPLIDLTDEFKDFADTAAFMENLDLIISVDTSVVHLAGALGKPVWTLLHFSPDWRYLTEGESCPWYASMRLFRQTKLGDWGGVFVQVHAALREHLSAPGARR